MTNEKILETFLKTYRKYASFKRQYKGDMSPITPISDAINTNFIWMETKEGHGYWEALDKKWRKLCRDFNLTDNVNLENL